MRKYLLAIALAALIAAFGLAAANPVQACWNCYTYEGDEYNDHSNDVTNNPTFINKPDIDITNTNRAFGGDATIEEGAVVNNNSNIIEEGAIKNKVDVDIKNKVEVNTTDVNINKNLQGQQQGQLQGQGQDQNQGQQQSTNQGQSQEMGDQKNKQSTEITIQDNKVITYEDKRDHITGPNILKADPKLTDKRALHIKTIGWEQFEALPYLSMSEAVNLGKAADDFKITKALLFENDFRGDRIYQLCPGETKGAFMGVLYLIPDGSDVTAAGGFGRLAEAAMKAGATHFVITSVDLQTVAEGRSVNIGIGGGASIMASGDTVAIAPNGGLGWGKATAKNDARPAAMAELYYDSNFVR